MNQADEYRLSDKCGATAVTVGAKGNVLVERDGTQRTPKKLSTPEALWTPMGDNGGGSESGDGDGCH